MWTAPHAIRLTTITLWHFDAAEWAPICPLRSDRVRCSASQRNDALCHSRRIDTLASSKTSASLRSLLSLGTAASSIRFHEHRESAQINIPAKELLEALVEDPTVSEFIPTMMGELKPLQ